MEAAGPTPKLDWDSDDLPAQWKKFRQHAEFMFKGPLSKNSEEEKCNYLMIWVGEKGREIHSTWTMTEAGKKSLEAHYQMFKAHVEPKSNIVFARYKFQGIVQAESETFDKFLTALKIQVDDCGYQNKDEMVRDRIVFGTKSEKVRERLINQGSDLTLEKAIEIARLHEMSQHQLKTMSMSEEDPMKKVNLLRRQKGATGENTGRNNGEKECGRCTFMHSDDRKCPAIGQTCRKCGKRDHFESKCFTRIRQTSKGYKGKQMKKRVHVIEVNSEDEEEQDGAMYVGSVLMVPQINSIRDEDAEYWSETISINKVNVTVELDTGARCNVLNYETFKAVNNKNALMKTSIPLRSFSGHNIKPLGTVQLPCSYGGKDYLQHFFVVDNKDRVPNILGSKTCRHMNLIRRVNTVKQVPDAPEVEEYKDLFKGLGCLPENTISK